MNLTVANRISPSTTFPTVLFVSLIDKKQQNLSNTNLKYTHTYLLNVSIEAEEIEDAGAVHLGWMEATHHGNGAGGMARV